MKYNTLLIVIKFAMQVFTKEKSVKTMHLQTDNATAIADFVKIGVTYNLELLPVAKEMLNVFQTNKGTAKYSPPFWMLKQIENTEITKISAIGR